jgi:hypothetical protein
MEKNLNYGILKSIPPDFHPSNLSLAISDCVKASIIIQKRRIFEALNSGQ